MREDLFRMRERTFNKAMLDAKKEFGGDELDQINDLSKKLDLRGLIQN
jgi:hypothetical protein